MAETETINTHEETAPESQEYVDEMVAKGEAALNAGQDEQQEQRPDWLPEKFSDAEQLAQAYACLLYTSPSPRDTTASRMPSSA